MAKILIVDDQEMPRSMLKEMLTEIFGHECVVASDGEEAVQKFEEEGPALVFMDLTMTNVDGLTATQCILAIDSKAAVIVCSSNFNEPEMENFGEYGFKAAITKPYRRGTLQKVLEQVLAD